MSSSKNNENYLLIVGSGPGIGLAVGRLFAQKQFNRVAIISRDSQRLEKDKQSIISAAEGKSLEVRTHSLDVAELPALRTTLDELKDFGTPECIFFNAARVRPSPLLQADTKEIEYDFQITNLALYEVAKWAMPALTSLAKSTPDARPSIIVTSSMLHIYPIPDMFSLSMTKAAQRTLVRCLSDRYAPQGVHCALISVGGVVDDKNDTVSAKTIAESIWAVYRQERGSFTFDVEVLEGIPSQV